ncbi:DUF6083 domain-containing protein [Streptomyces sp. NPDC059862]|uniref:DUF6083 domain-containing protein n=1 Tax=Streptomyces sp. NPDC059862 TaxID=3346975 RepID=UPI00365112D2
MALLYERCWKAYADEIALQEDATDTPRPEPDPDDVTPYEPPRCPHCKAEVSPYLTNYDRWVHLATRDYPAKDAPPRYRWRLVAVLARHSSVPTGSVAVRSAVSNHFPATWYAPPSGRVPQPGRRGRSRAGAGLGPVVRRRPD